MKINQDSNKKTTDHNDNNKNIKHHITQDAPVLLTIDQLRTPGADLDFNSLTSGEQATRSKPGQRCK